MRYAAFMTIGMPIDPPRRQSVRARRIRANVRLALLGVAVVLLLVSLLMGWK